MNEKAARILDTKCPVCKAKIERSVYVPPSAWARTAFSGDARISVARIITGICRIVRWGGES